MEPPAKKPKVTKDVYESFFNSYIFTVFEEVVDVLCSSRMAALEILTITNCNASFGNGIIGKPFSRADVDIFENKDYKLFPFGSIFLHGFMLLKNFLRNPKIAPPEKQEDCILSKLLSFLLDEDNEKCLMSIRQKHEQQECDLAVSLTVHLFSKLCISPAFTLDQYYPGRSSNICSCGCLTDVSKCFGDTSIGNTKVWHGWLDVILGNSLLPIAVIEEEPDPPERKTHEDINVEKNINLEHPDVTSQLLSETIVFSFTQRKNHPEYHHFLIPSIGVNRHRVIFYFYDSENDFLLKSKTFPIFAGSKLNLEAILAIWFVVNYNYLSSGCSEEILDDGSKAGFFTHADSLLPVYQNELSVGGIKSQSKILLVEEYEPASLHHAKLGCTPSQLIL